MEDVYDFLDNASVGLHCVGADGLIQWANITELESLGYTPEEYIGKHISLFHADQDVINDILARLTNGETLDNYPARLLSKDGNIRHVLINSNVYRINGKFEHTRCFTRDVTELVNFQLLVTNLESELEERKKIMSELDTMNSDIKKKLKKYL
ncbi:MAG: PAS domain S-box protein [Candidatus Thorarchaeota archaeon]|jgi:PAS domain S-box-containing protein